MLRVIYPLGLKREKITKYKRLSLKILTIETIKGIYRISIYPGSMGNILSVNNNNLPFPSNWHIVGFSRFRSHRAFEVKVDIEKIKEFAEKHIDPKVLMGGWVYDVLGDKQYLRRWSHRIHKIYFNEASPEEITKIIKARILK